MKTIIYVHGWESSPEGSTAKEFRARFSDYNFVCPELTKYPRVNFELVRNCYLDRQKDEEPIIVGSSWGGLFALLVGRFFKAKTVLINPSLNPIANLRKYNAINADNYDIYAAMEDYVWLNGIHYKDSPLCVIVGNNDDTVCPEKNGALYCDDFGHKLVTIDEGHRISSKENYDVVENEIRKLANTVC